MASLNGLELFNLFSTGEYSDFTVICKDRKFKVHKMVICPNSDFFRAIAKGSFQEQDSVTLQESDPDIIATVLHYLYFASYHIGDEACVPAQHFMLQEASMFDSTREDEGFRALKIRTKSKNDPELAELRTHFQVYKAADMLGVDKLKRAATFHILKTAQMACSANFFAIFLESIYTTLPESDTILRPAITHSCAVNYDRLCCHAEIFLLMEKYESALWTAAGVMTRIHNVRMAGFGKEVVTQICQDRLCSCGGTTLKDPEVVIEPNSSTINVECDQCGDTFFVEFDET